MHPIKKIPELNKDKLVKRIKELFYNVEKYHYKRELIELFDKENHFIGDNLIETTFSMNGTNSPMIYEISGPYDAISKEYATIARVYNHGILKYEFDLKSGILQRTAAMTWLYLESLKHRPKQIIIIGAGKLGIRIAKYLKHFNINMKEIDYNDVGPKIDGFEMELHSIQLKANYIKNPKFANYDTIILATNTVDNIINENNISDFTKGAVIVSLCTSSQNGEISKEVYAGDVNIFLDYALTKTFTEDMRVANKAGYLEKSILYETVVRDEINVDLNAKLNIIRLTGTPFQNIAVIDMMLEEDGFSLDSEYWNK